MPFVWLDKCEENFQKLDIYLTISLILLLSVEDKNIIVLCDDLVFGCYVDAGQE